MPSDKTILRRCREYGELHGGHTPEGYDSCGCDMVGGYDDVEVFTRDALLSDEAIRAAADVLGDLYQDNDPEGPACDAIEAAIRAALTGTDSSALRDASSVPDQLSGERP